MDNKFRPRPRDGEREREREKPFGNLTLHAVKFFAEKLGSLGGAFTGVVPALSLVKRRK